MRPDDHVCLCFRVSLRKLQNHLERERPTVASRLSECLGAGTGCGWCVPFLRRLHAQHAAGTLPALEESPEDYARRRSAYRAGRRVGPMIDPLRTPWPPSPTVPPSRPSACR